MDLVIYTDGGSRGNPGPAAFALLIYDIKGKLLESHSEYIGENTNNVAEYRGMLKALKMAKKHGDGNVTCTMDSELAVMQLSGKYKVKKPHLKELYEMVKAEEKNFRSVKYEHVKRENQYITCADAMLNRTLDRVKK
ncbi:MAG: ribonuclease HI family protein [Candidatus Aenigmarchaeota archaeon]|nr:ribonuclease HI family protein [Candidatus Aenigmarchaeota archaeon]